MVRLLTGRGPKRQSEIQPRLTANPRGRRRTRSSANPCGPGTASTPAWVMRKARLYRREKRTGRCRPYAAVQPGPVPARAIARLRLEDQSAFHGGDSQSRGPWAGGEATGCVKMIIVVDGRQSTSSKRRRLMLGGGAGPLPGPRRGTSSGSEGLDHRSLQHPFRGRWDRPQPPRNHGRHEPGTAGRALPHPSAGAGRGRNGQGSIWRD